MNKNKIIEVATYIVVPLVMLVVSPLLGKFLDSFYFDHPYTFAKSIPVIIAGTITLLCGKALVAWTIFL